jgi:purine nucleosidase
MGEMKTVIFDHDAHSDDLIVLMMLVRSPSVQLIGTTVCPGDCYRDAGVKSTRGVLAALGVDASVVPVAASDDEGQYPFPEEWRADSVKLADVCGPNESSAAESAVPFLARLLEEAIEPVTMVITGPSTHLGALLASRPDLVKKVERVWVMGGAVRVPGNVPGMRAEWNFHNHPTGAAQLVASGAPITLVALDATNHAPLTRAFLDKVQSPLARSIWEPIIRQVENDNYEQTYYFWDTLTAAAMLHPGLLRTERVKVTVLPDGETREDNLAGHDVDLGVGVDVSALESLVLELLAV